MSKVRIVVPISGGKDSEACLKLASENYPAQEIRGLFCDTQFEHPVTYDHVEKLKARYGHIRIDTVTAGSVPDVCERFGRFPGGGSRHCTDYLKIRPTRRYLRALALEQGSFVPRRKANLAELVEARLGGFQVWYGMRHEESAEREKRYAGKICDELYHPHEVIPGKYPKYLAAMGVVFRLAVLTWSEQDVLDFVGEENLNPLYAAGFPRVGCFPCQASGDKWKEKAYRHDEFGQQQYRRIKIVAEKINKPMFTSKGGQAREALNPICELMCS